MLYMNSRNLQENPLLVVAVLLTVIYLKFRAPSVQSYRTSAGIHRSHSGALLRSELGSDFSEDIHTCSLEKVVCSFSAFAVFLLKDGLMGKKIAYQNPWR